MSLLLILHKFTKLTYTRNIRTDFICNTEHSNIGSFGNRCRTLITTDESFNPEVTYSRMEVYVKTENLKL